MFRDVQRSIVIHRILDAIQLCNEKSQNTMLQWKSNESAHYVFKSEVVSFRLSFLATLDHAGVLRQLSSRDFGGSFQFVTETRMPCSPGTTGGIVRAIIACSGAVVTLSASAVAVLVTATLRASKVGVASRARELILATGLLTSHGGVESISAGSLRAVVSTSTSLGLKFRASRVASKVGAVSRARELILATGFLAISSRRG